MNAERISTRPAKLGGNIRDVAMDGGDVIKLGGNICEVAVDGGDVEEADADAEAAPSEDVVNMDSRSEQ